MHSGSGLHTFKTKAFARFARRERIRDRALCEAVERIAEGLIDADLGGGVIKQRIARKGGGRSGGFRDRAASPRRTGILRVRIRQERTGQSAPG